MAVQKLSQITLAGSAPALTDFVVGVSAANVDLLYSLAQVKTSVGSGIISVGSTTVTGGSGNNILYDNAGVVGEVTIGSNLTFSGGVLAASGGGGITVNTTTITGGTSGLVAYDNAGTFGEASNLSISSGQPNVASGSAYLYNGEAIAYGLTAGGNWFFAHSGNFSVSGSHNSAFGDFALSSVSTGNDNSADGQQALQACSTGNGNVAIGSNSLQHLTIGSSNFAMGVSAMINAIDAADCVAIGPLALGGVGATSASDCVAIGHSALATCNSSGNIGIGSFAAQSLTSADHGVYIGDTTAQGITTGYRNVIIGASAGGAINAGVHNIIIGDSANALSDNNSQINIGNLIFGTGVATGTTVSTGSVGVGIVAPGTTLDVNGRIRGNDATALIAGATALNNGAGVGAGTLTNAPAAGNPTKWIPIVDAGVTRFIPAW